MRLIDADKLIEEMRKWYWDKEKQKAAEEDASPLDLFTHLAITTVQNQPTAFDVDKIIEKLEDYLFEKYCVEGNDDNIEKIVKGGGVE